MKQKKQIIIFTDLDGSLLDKDTFRFDEIEDYFKELISKGIKIIPNSSKTENELLDFNKQYNLNLPFISENGSSIHGLNLIHKDLPNKISISRTVDQIISIYNESVPNDLKQKINFILKYRILKKYRIQDLQQKNPDCLLHQNLNCYNCFYKRFQLKFHEQRAHMMNYVRIYNLPQLKNCHYNRLLWIDL